MKIISKYKDYYDYLAGVYGIDEKLVLDRTDFGKVEFKGCMSFYICGKVIDGYYDEVEKRFYFGEELKIKFPKDQARKNKWYYSHYAIRNKETNVINFSVNDIRYTLSLDVYDDKNNLNEKYNCPILCHYHVKYPEPLPEPIRFPKLDESGMSRIFPPHDIYMMLCEWLGKEKEITDNRTNEEKILSAGFDTKISFRNIK